mgnify:CR=1 FL=1
MRGDGPEPSGTTVAARDVRAGLLSWYDVHARALPWRVSQAARRAGARPDPYRVWLSEIMLQQTTVPHATPYFLDFTTRWPTVDALAAAEDGAVMAAWAGLGYYARARNLLACARVVAERHGGRFPDTEAGLLGLPGVGAYTAAAVAAIAFDRPANVVDGNVERVIARIYAVEAPLPAAKPALKHLAGALVADDRPGDWAQALMDLGATVCRPRAPLCERCPVRVRCAAHATGAPADYPRRQARRERPRRFGAVYLVRRGEALALVRRPARGLLGGMLGLPTSAWRTEPLTSEALVDAAPVSGAWRVLGEVEHVFTHFALTLTVLEAEADPPPGAVLTADLSALPSVFLKAAALAGPADARGRAQQTKARPQRS